MVANSLFIGRFQPFHIGHLADIRGIVEKGERCIIAIAAANKAGMELNPLTAAEREYIIKETLAAETDLDQTQYEVHQLTDIDDDDIWAEHVVSNMPPFEKVYSGSVYVRNFFIKDGRFPALPVKMVLEENGEPLCATNIRKRILKGENCGGSLRPRTLEILNEIGFQKRLANIKKTAP